MPQYAFWLLLLETGGRDKSMIYSGGLQRRGENSMTFPWVRVSSKFSAENGGEVVGGHDHHNGEGTGPRASAVHENPGRKAHRALRAAGSAAIVVAGITAYSLAFAASPASDEPAHVQWRENMRHKAAPGEGCFQASFPAVRWEPAPCQAGT